MVQDSSWFNLGSRFLPEEEEVSIQSQGAASVPSAFEVDVFSTGALNSSAAKMIIKSESSSGESF